MIADPTDARATEQRAPSLLTQVAGQIQNKPFVPARFLTQGDLQTFGAFFWPRRFSLPDDLDADEERLFAVEAGTQVLARCHWQPDRTQHPTLVIWHGLEGSVTSRYMLTAAAKARQRGFNVVRMNVRNCGGTEHLTPTLYHGGLTHDLRAVLDELISEDRLPRIVIAGFSLGGNMTLKLGGEYGADAPQELKAIAAISPSADLAASFALLNQPRNLIYHRNFLLYLKRRIRFKERLYPDLYDSSDLRRVRTMEQFDDRFVAPAFGFADARDYYAKASSVSQLGRIRVPTLIIHAKDDPFIPFAPLESALNPQGHQNSANPSDVFITSNENVLLVAPPRGGHTAFLGAPAHGEDRFWSENRLVDFAELATGS